MCGIVGVVGGKPLSIMDKKVFKDMLMMDVVRGKDGCGIIVVNDKMEVRTLKTLTNIAYWLETPQVQALLDQPCLAIIGHNRAATVGKVKVKNNHPFTHKHITGVHNGTLYDQNLLDDSHRFAVDSDNLYYHLSKNGVKDMYASLWGAAALVWVNDKQKSINFLRNDERPLHYVELRENTVVFSSEALIGEAAIDRNEAFYGHRDWLPFKVDQLYTWRLGTPLNWDTQDLSDDVCLGDDWNSIGRVGVVEAIDAKGRAMVKSLYSKGSFTAALYDSDKAQVGDVVVEFTPYRGCTYLVPRHLSNKRAFRAYHRLGYSEYVPRPEDGKGVTCDLCKQIKMKVLLNHNQTLCEDCFNKFL